MSRVRVVVASVAAVAAVAAVVLAGPVVALQLDESAVPPASAGRLPDGVRVTDRSVECGSGGCWRELTVSGTDGRTPAETARRLGAPYETCAARSWIDRREVCTGVQLVGGRLVVSVRYRRPLDL